MVVATNREQDCDPDRLTVDRAPFDALAQFQDGDRIGCKMRGFAMRHRQAAAKAGRVGVLALPDFFLDQLRPGCAPRNLKQIDRGADRLLFRAAIDVDGDQPGRQQERSRPRAGAEKLRDFVQERVDDEFGPTPSV